MRCICSSVACGGPKEQKKGGKRTRVQAASERRPCWPAVVRSARNRKLRHDPEEQHKQRRCCGMRGRTRALHCAEPVFSLWTRVWCIGTLACFGKLAIEAAWRTTRRRPWICMDEDNWRARQARMLRPQNIPMNQVQKFEVRLLR